MRAPNRAASFRVQGSDVVSSSQCFVCDVSCLGSDASGFVESGGPGSSGRFTRSGGETGMLVGVKGFHSGKHYWEILNGSEGGLGASSSAVDIKFGIVPRAVDTRIDVTRSIEENQGYCVTLAQGRHVKTGDTVGVLLDMTGGSARLSFFVNHKFSRHAASIVNIPKSKAFFPAVSLEGNDQTRYKDELSARRVALAHNGSTVEISSHLSEDLKLNVAFWNGFQMVEKAESGAEYVTQIADPKTPKISGPTFRDTDKFPLHMGDAILFVDLEDVADDNEWRFAIDREEVVSQDVFYLHREFDLNTIPGRTVLKVAFKFVALRAGVATFRSCYGRASGGSGGQQSWRQAVRILVQQAD
eukprot:g5851.t1